MINGIEVLNTYEVSNPKGPLGLILLIFGAIICATIISFGLYDIFINKEDWEPVLIACTVVIIIGLAMLIPGIILLSNNTIGETITHYDVVIGEDVNFIEFTNKYNIVEQHGKIFTITEK